ncbi:hypothetical protein KGA66_05980 [Actinocrinis puniceicyclus]|uniref:Uncharacterized protein n=1 Tax=Actinocrinis puniceicyclus TaxID=977794 RepID=A0A8J8BA55_9ACTN|nr:hypothetical protein [Actinocrinis puniceicyclus]MBS2962587.1 hypothetical protein [Actinocrinis puniceicyclus]
MRAPWRRHRRQPADASALAVRDARAALQESARSGPEVADLVARLRAIREVNHFSERVAQLLQEQRRG